MYLTYVTYALLVILLLWGGKFAGFQKEYHDDFMSLEVTKSLRGFAAIGVILHHISQEQPFQEAHELGLFVNIGYLFVAIFFFCSGYGLLKSYDSKPDYLNSFLRKRMPTLLVPFYVSSILYAVFRALMGEHMPIGKWITGLLGVTMMNEYAWFPIVLAILYIAFYIIFKKVKNRSLCLFLIFLVILLQGIAFCVFGHFAWWAGPKNWWMQFNAENNMAWWKEQKVLWFSGEWWVNSSISFLLGMLFANHENGIIAWFKKLYGLKLFVVFVLAGVSGFVATMTQWKFGYWSEYSGKGPGIGDKLICYVAQLPQITFFVILIFLFMMKYHASNPVSRFFGKVSLETYMMNLMAITIFRFWEYKNNMIIHRPGNYNLAIYAVCVFAGTILLGIIYKWINDQIIKRIK